MELRQLRYFTAVAEDLHFGHAAARLHIVQPALSRQIALLERELGTELFARTGRGIALTEAGADLLADARRILALADTTRNRALRAGLGQRGVLTVGFIAPAVYDALPRTLRALQRAAPEVRLVLHELANDQAVDGLDSGELDVAFVRLPVTAAGPLDWEVVSDEPVLIALPHDHPLADQAEVALADLSGDSFVMIPRAQEPDLFDHYVGLCRDAGFSPAVGHEADRTHVTLALVSGGLGVAFVPASSVAGWAGVAARPLAGIAPRLTLAIAWRGGPGSAVLSRFRELRPWEPGGMPVRDGSIANRSLSRPPRRT